MCNANNYASSVKELENEMSILLLCQVLFQLINSFKRAVVDVVTV